MKSVSLEEKLIIQAKSIAAIYEDADVPTEFKKIAISSTRDHFNAIVDHMVMKLYS